MIGLERNTKAYGTIINDVPTLGSHLSEHLVSSAGKFSCRHYNIDPERWFIFMVCTCENRHFLLANIYVPPPYIDAVLKQICLIFVKYSSYTGINSR